MDDGQATDTSGAEDARELAALPAIANGRRAGSRDPQVFVLLRELSEVHLLLDHVSAKPHATVSERPADTHPKELGADWIEKICKISWPPDGSEEEKAEDAALLIRAKDYLNRLAQPASGATIAFTLLVTQQNARQQRGASSAKAAPQADETPRRPWWRPSLLDRGGAPPTRNSLAQAAYPELVPKAVGFRYWMTAISIGLLVTLLVTCGLSWYVAEGNAALAEFKAARTAVTEVQTRINQAEAEAADAASAVPTAAAGAASAAPTRALPAPAAEAAQASFVPLCQRPTVSAIQWQLCQAHLEATAALARAEGRLTGWDCRRPYTDCTGMKEGDAPSRAAAFVNIMGSAVLPFFYGLLGAGAAIIRSLSRKIRESLLSPRDLHLSTQQLALGAVVGACIGLFVAAPDTSGEGLLGPVTLSASAISFVAGFGVEAVFQALEALISRIFNLAPNRTGARSDSVGAG